ncbi:MAG: hypothetical protein V1863_03185 [Candidatus Omnitrophota bacterium]
MKFFSSQTIILTVIVFFEVSVVLAQPKQNSGYSPQGKRDPFVSLITPAGYLLDLEPQDDSELRLEGIMFDANGDSVAIINGELIRVGETIGDVVVGGIEKDRVTVIKNNEKIELELRREE